MIQHSPSDHPFSDAYDFLRVTMATPKLADAAVDFAANANQDILTTLAQVAKLCIPCGHRVGFMAGALAHLADRRTTLPLPVPNPETLHFCETITGEVYWRDVSAPSPSLKDRYPDCFHPACGIE